MFGTILFYNSIVTLSTYLVWVSERLRPKVFRFLPITLALLVVSLPVGFRYGLGGDYFNYALLFEQISLGTYSGNLELGFVYLNRLVGLFGYDYEVFTIIFSILIYAIAIIGYPQGNKAIVHFLFLMLLFFSSFNQIRSVISLSIMLVALFDFQKNGRIVNYLFLTCLASLFHKSFVLYLIIPVIYLVLYSGAYKLIFYIVLVSIVPIYFFKEIVVNVLFNNPISKVLGFNLYEFSRYNTVAQMNLGLGFLSKLFILLIPLSQFKAIIKNNSKNIILLLVIAACLFSSILKLESRIFGRLEYVFYLGYIFSIYLIACQYRMFSKAYVYISVVLLLMIFNKDIISGRTDYESVCLKDGRAITPYVSIFNKHDSDNYGGFPCVVGSEQSWQRVSR